MPDTGPKAVDHGGAELEARAQASAATGSLLFHLALAEAVAGDALSGRFDGEPVGWALDVGADGYEVVAVGLGAPDIRARVTFAADGAPLVETGRAGRASPRQGALARVRDAGTAHAATLGGRWRVLPVPPVRGVPLPPVIETYLVRSPERPGDLVAGPHWRLEVDAGEAAVRRAELDCSLDAVTPDAAGPGRPVAVLTHENGEVPSPVHVMLSLQLGVVIEVHTPRSDLRWRIDGEGVRRATAE